MQTLNFCRQAVQFIKSPNWRRVSPYIERFGFAQQLIERSQKFYLPPGGRLIGDRQYKALYGTELNLPFPCIALEYTPIDQGGDLIRGTQDGWKVKKTIAIFEQKENFIFGMAMWCFRELPSVWSPSPQYMIPRTDFVGTDCLQIGLHVEEGMNPVDCQDEIGALLDMLNALSCSNVDTTRIDPKHGAKIKHGLPFDSYHVLTIKQSVAAKREALGGSHRSPREHLRRGHVRRLESGLNIWVNATVVNPGVGGVVSKAYRMAA